MEFDALHEAIGHLVRARWPATRRKNGATTFGLDAYVVPVKDHPPKEAWKGTLPNDVFIVAPTAKKAGITIHVWHPNHPNLLKEHADWLKEAGFKPMVGCLQWNRKAPLDLEAFGKLLDQIP